MSRNDVVRRLRALASRGVPISVRYLLPVHADLVGQALAIFGSFDRARAVAGLAAPPLEHDVDVIIGALRSLARSGVRLDVPTLSTMGESALVAACVETFGSVQHGAARAGLGAPPPEPVRRPGYGQHAGYGGGGGGYGARDRYDRDDRYDRHERAAPGFAQPPITTDGNVSTAMALEHLQKTAIALGRVPAARDLPPDVARRLTQDYGSVRFAYLALRVHAEGQGGAARSAENAAQAAAEPVANLTAEALEATARMPDSVGIHRRNVEEAQAQAAAPVVEVSEEELAEAWAEVEAEIEAASAGAADRLRAALDGVLEEFVGRVADLARHATLEALVPGTRPNGAGHAAAAISEEEEEEEGEDDEYEDDDGEYEDDDEGDDEEGDGDDEDGADDEPDAAAAGDDDAADDGSDDGEGDEAQLDDET